MAVVPSAPPPVDPPPVVVIPVAPVPVPPAPLETSVSGTAATGAALSNSTITLKDSANRSVTQVTNAVGGYLIRTTGLTPPFMLQLTTRTGGKLYSVSADANNQSTVNLTPITDLILRSWYATQGVAIDSAFANPNAAPPPTPQQVGSISQTVFSLLGLAIPTHAADITAPEQLISRPFAADGTGVDKLLDNLRVSSSTNGATMTVTAGLASQVTSISYNTATTAISASSTATNGTATSTSVLTSVVPVSSAQTAALDDINATFTRLQNVVNARGTSLAVADVLPFADADLLDRGQDRARFAAGIAHSFGGGQTVRLSVEQVKSLDVAAGLAAVMLRINATVGTLISNQSHLLFLRKVGGVWLLSGDNRIADVTVSAEARRSQGATTGGDGPAINTGVEAVEGLVSSITVGPFGTVAGGTSTSIDAGVRLTGFYALTVLSAPLPVAGTPIAVTLSKSAGGSVTYTLPLNAFTTEAISITNVTGLTLGKAKPGTTVNVSWTLPTTYVVGTIKLSATTTSTVTGPQNKPSTVTCRTDEPLLAINATSAALAIPATCSGSAVISVSINLSTDGSNGERSSVVYSF